MDDVKTSQKERERIYCHDNVLHAYSWRAQDMQIKHQRF